MSCDFLSVYLFRSPNSDQYQLLPSCSVHRPSVCKIFTFSSSLLKTLNKYEPNLAAIVLGLPPFQSMSDRSKLHPNSHVILELAKAALFEARTCSNLNCNGKLLEAYFPGFFLKFMILQIMEIWHIKASNHNKSSSLFS